MCVHRRRWTARPIGHPCNLFDARAHPEVDRKGASLTTDCATGNAVIFRSISNNYFKILFTRKL
jgi:hypothetical protein